MSTTSMESIIPPLHNRPDRIDIKIQCAILAKLDSDEARNEWLEEFSTLFRYLAEHQKAFSRLVLSGDLDGIQRELDKAKAHAMRIYERILAELGSDDERRSWTHHCYPVFHTLWKENSRFEEFVLQSNIPAVKQMVQDHRPQKDIPCA